MAKVSDAQFRRDVKKEIYSTDGVWGPSTEKMTQVSPNKLKGKIKSVYQKMKRQGESPDIYTRKIDERPVYLFVDTDTGIGATSFDLRNASGSHLEIGNKPHKKQTLPHSEEPAVPVSDEQYLEDLRDAMRYPIAASDTPIITGSKVPAKIAEIVEKMKAEVESDGIARFQDVEVHHVRVDGRDAYLVYGDAYDYSSRELFDAAGKKLDVL